MIEAIVSSVSLLLQSDLAGKIGFVALGTFASVLGMFAQKRFSLSIEDHKSKLAASIEKQKAEAAHTKFIIEKVYGILEEARALDSTISVGEFIEFRGNQVPSDPVNKLIFKTSLMIRNYRLIKSLCQISDDSIEAKINEYLSLNRKLSEAGILRTAEKKLENLRLHMIQSCGPVVDSVEAYIEVVLGKFVSKV